MKENDVRVRIQAFLKNTVRYVVVPASVGIGLALIGCGDSSQGLRSDAEADVAVVAGQGGQGGTGGVGGNATLYAAPMRDAASSDLGTGGVGGNATLYAAPMRDAASSDLGTGGVGGFIALYAAPALDAARADLGAGGTTVPVSRYGGVFPDARGTGGTTSGGGSS